MFASIVTTASSRLCSEYICFPIPNFYTSPISGTSMHPKWTFLANNMLLRWEIILTCYRWGNQNLDCETCSGLLKNPVDLKTCAVLPPRSDAPLTASAMLESMSCTTDKHLGDLDSLGALLQSCIFPWNSQIYIKELKFYKGNWGTNSIQQKNLQKVTLHIVYNTQVSK